jgi:hypothetical protein
MTLGMNLTVLQERMIPVRKVLAEKEGSRNL